jgi:hypothetical protein
VQIKIGLGKLRLRRSLAEIIASIKLQLCESQQDGCE